MTSASSLSVDLWHVVSLQVGSARALAAMVGVSKEWRAAVTNESWCRVTLECFPRVVAIVTALEMETPVYREVYRDQLACTFPAAAAPPSSVDERLRTFVFTIEFFINGNSLWSWTGHLQSKLEGVDSMDQPACIGCRLWTENNRPPWAIQYLATRRRRSQYRRMTARILVTKKNGTCIRTRILTDLIPDFLNDTAFSMKERDNSSTIIDSGDETFTPLVYRTDLPGGTALIQGRAAPQVFVEQGIFDFMVLTPDVGEWSPEEAVDFLERFVAW